MWVFFLISSILGNELSQFSFRSPFMPDHSQKFLTKGDAVPLRKFIRLGPPRPRSSGGIQTSSPINETSFEIQVIFNSAGESPTENIGLSLWLSPRPEPLGHLYGLSPDFRGVSLFIDISKQKLFSQEFTDTLSIDSILSSSHCPIDFKNKQSSIHLHINNNFLEIWIKDRRMRKCLSFTINEYSSLYFGISSYSGESSNSVFDVLQVLTTELDDEDNENLALKKLEDKVKNELKILEDSLNVLKFRIKDIHNSREYVNVAILVQEIANKLQRVYIRTADLRIKMNSVHVETGFVELSNKEIALLKDQLGRMNVKIENLMFFLSSGKVFEEVKGMVNGQYDLSMKGVGEIQSELKGVGGRIEGFKKEIVSDDRIWWMHLGFVGLLVVNAGLLALVFRIEKIKTII